MLRIWWTAAGRRSALSDWLAAVGSQPVAEEVDDTGIVYFSRFYRLNEGQVYPPRAGPIGGDLGYLKYGVFVGDNNTFSVTLATPTNDDQLRKILADPDVFDECARQLVATAPWLDGRATPITEQVCYGRSSEGSICSPRQTRWRRTQTSALACSRRGRSARTGRPSKPSAPNTASTCWPFCPRRTN